MANLHAFFAPRSIAIIGASRDPKRISGRPLDALKIGRFAGRIYPVNPHASAVQGLEAFPDLASVPDSVDLAVIATPAESVADALTGCVAAKVPAAVIFASGFRETGPQGGQAETSLQEIALSGNVRLLGPNCMGAIDFRSGSHASFSSSYTRGWPRTGPVSIVAQSGAIASYLMVNARERGIGLSKWIATGNECDIDVAECLEYLAQDVGTQVVAIYLEGCRDGRRLVAGLRALKSSGKAAIIIKAGRSSRGAAAAASHTAALAGDDAVFDTAFESAGARRVRTLNELLNVVQAAASLARLRGRRTAIASTSGGAGILLCDEAEAAGLEVIPTPPDTQRHLATLLSSSGTANPIDLTARVLDQPELIGRAFEAILAGGWTDVLVAFFGTLGFNERALARVCEVQRTLKESYPQVPIVLVMSTAPEFLPTLEESGIVAYAEPADAIQALAGLHALERPLADTPRVHDSGDDHGVLRPANPLDELEARTLLSRAGIALNPVQQVFTPSEAQAAAVGFKGTAALKILSRDLPHKTEIGGVRLNVEAAAVPSAFASLIEQVRIHAPEADISGVLIGPMAPSGLELIIGARRDPVFGPIVMVGAGGIAAEAAPDVALALAPVAREHALALLEKLKISPLFRGFRNQPPLDVEAVVSLIDHLAKFIVANSWVHSVDLNPVRVYESGRGALALDALIIRDADTLS